MRSITLVAIVLAAAACSTSSPGSPSTPSAGSPATASSTPTASASAGNKLTLPPGLPTSCNTFLGVSAVEAIIGRRVPVPPSYLWERPLASGRLGRVTCTYWSHHPRSGWPPPAAFAATVNLYANTKTVSDRIRLTVAIDRAAGNRITNVRAAGRPAILDASATRTTLILGYGRRTLVFQLDRAMVSTTPANRALMELAELAVRALPGLPTPLVTPS